MFAKSNSLNYTSQTKLGEAVSSGLIYLPDKGVIYTAGHHKKYTDLFGDSKLSVGNYYFITGYGRDQKEHKVVVASIKLSRSLPNIILDAKSNNSFGFSNLPESFKRDQVVTAEAALTDYFTLYAPKGYKIDSLSFIAPDFIAVLRERFTGCDIEIIDDTLYIYMPGELKKDDYKKMFLDMQAITRALEDNVKNYIDQRAATASIGIQGLDSIAPQGRRLAKSNITKIAAAIAIAIYVAYLLIGTLIK